MEYTRRQILYLGGMAVGSTFAQYLPASAYQIPNGNRGQRPLREDKILDILEHYSKRPEVSSTQATRVLDDSFSSQGHSYGIRVNMPESVFKRLAVLKDVFGIGSLIDSMRLFSDEYFLEIPRGERVSLIERFDRNYDPVSGFNSANIVVTVPIEVAASKRKRQSPDGLLNAANELELQILIAINEMQAGAVSDETTANFVLAKKNLGQALSLRTS